MLRLIDAPTFRAPVKFGIGEGREVEFVCEFRHMPTSELVLYLRAAQEMNSPEGFWRRLLRWLSERSIGRALRAFVPARKTDADYLADIIVSWEGVDQAFSVESAQRLVDLYPHASSVILNVWAAELRKLRLGN